MTRAEKLAEEYLKQRFPAYQKDASVMHIDIEVFLAGYRVAIEEVSAENARLREALKQYLTIHHERCDIQFGKSCDCALPSIARAALEGK